MRPLWPHEINNLRCWAEYERGPLRRMRPDKPRYRYRNGYARWMWVGGAARNDSGAWPMRLTCADFFLCNSGGSNL